MTRGATKLAQGLQVISQGLALVASALLESEAEARATPARERSADDAFIDQTSELVPRNLYLQLARAGAFPSKKHGKRIVAQWGDVRAAISGLDPNLSEAGDGHDELDIHRRNVGLATRSRP